MLVGAGSAGSSVDPPIFSSPRWPVGNYSASARTTFDEYRKHIESDAALPAASSQSS